MLPFKENEYIRTGGAMCNNTGRHMGFSVYHKKTGIIIFGHYSNLVLVNHVFDLIKHLDWNKETIQEINEDKELIAEVQKILYSKYIGGADDTSGK